MARALGLATLALFVALAWYLRPLDPGVLALQFAATPRAFAAVVHAWGPEGLARYRTHLGFDFVLLGSYAAFGWVLARPTGPFAALPASLRVFARITLPLAAAFDAVENLLHLWLTQAPRFGVAWVYAVSAGTAAAKWLLILGFAVLAGVALARRRRPG